MGLDAATSKVNSCVVNSFFVYYDIFTTETNWFVFSCFMWRLEEQTNFCTYFFPPKSALCVCRTICNCCWDVVTIFPQQTRIDRITGMAIFPGNEELHASVLVCNGFASNLSKWQCAQMIDGNRLKLTDSKQSFFTPLIRRYNSCSEQVMS